MTKQCQFIFRFKSRCYTRKCVTSFTSNSYCDWECTSKV